jgi:hypothetical protein
MYMKFCLSNFTQTDEKNFIGKRSGSSCKTKFWLFVFYRRNIEFFSAGIAP